MATIVRGIADASVQALKTALDAYEAAHDGAEASLYRSNAASVRIRVIDRRFEGMSKPRRHDHVWQFLTGHGAEQAVADISLLLTVAPAEVGNSLANLDFEQPVAY